jgi:hypothetical protein
LYVKKEGKNNGGNETANKNRHFRGRRRIGELQESRMIDIGVDPMHVKWEFP